MNQRKYILFGIFVIVSSLACYLFYLRGWFEIAPKLLKTETTSDYCTRVYRKTQKCPADRCETGCAGDDFSDIGGCVVGCNPKPVVR